MTTLIDNKLVFLLLVLILVALLAVVTLAIVSQGTGLAIVDTSMLRYCESSGGVCTGF